MTFVSGSRGAARAALLALLLLVPGPARAVAVFTVTSTGEAWDVIPGDGVCDTGIGARTLRAAIQESNATPGADTIAFSLPPPGPHSIPVGSMLPAIDDPVTIDATTQPGYAGRPIVELNGAGAGPGSHGLSLRAGSTTIRGLVINRFDNQGVSIQGPAGDNTVSGNYIGTDLSGSFALPNREGIGVGDSPGNMIGGSAPPQRNVISGNRDGCRSGGPARPATSSTATTSAPTPPVRTRSATTRSGSAVSA